MANKKSSKPTAKPAKKWQKRKVTKGEKKRKLGGWWLVANIASFGLIIGTAVVIYLGPEPDRSPPPAPVVPTKEVTLYFGNRDGESLHGVNHTIKESNLNKEIAEAIEALLDGPKKGQKRAERAVPEGTRLKGVTVKGSTAIVDLSSEVVNRHGGGTAAEIQTIFSIVNTVGLGWPEIRDVQLLIEGERVETIAGHIDIKLPIQPDRTLNSN